MGGCRVSILFVSSFKQNFSASFCDSVSEALNKKRMLFEESPHALPIRVFYPTSLLHIFMQRWLFLSSSDGFWGFVLVTALEIVVDIANAQSDAVQGHGHGDVNIQENVEGPQTPEQLMEHWLLLDMQLLGEDFMEPILPNNTALWADFIFLVVMKSIFKDCHAPQSTTYCCLFFCGIFQMSFHSLSDTSSVFNLGWSALSFCHMNTSHTA